MNRPLVEVALTHWTLWLPPLEAVPADRIAIEEFRAKRRPQINATAQDLKQKHAARRARQQAAKAPEA